MITEWDSLQVIENSCDSFAEWVNFIRLELKLHLPQQRDRIDVFKVVFKKDSDDLVHGCIRKMDRYLEQAEPQHKSDIVYNSIARVESICRKINSYSEIFTLKKVQDSFAYLRVDWDEKDFDLFKQASDIAIIILESHFEKYLPGHLDNCKNLLSEENKEEIISYPKRRPFMKKIVDNFLKDEPLLAFEINKRINTIETKKSLKTYKSFEVDIKKHIQHGILKDILILHEIQNDNLKDMMDGLLKYKHIHKDTKLKQFIKIFSGEEITEKVKWIGQRNHLRYFIERLYKEKLKKVTGDYYWEVANSCFDIGEDPSRFSKLLRDAEKTMLPNDKIQLDQCIDRLRKIQSE